MMGMARKLENIYIYMITPFLDDFLERSRSKFNYTLQKFRFKLGMIFIGYHNIFRKIIKDQAYIYVYEYKRIELKVQLKSLSKGVD